MVDKAKLNEWAAEYMGDEAEEVAEAVDAEWYTGFVGAAAVVMSRCAEKFDVSVTIRSRDKITVKVGDSQASRTGGDLAGAIIEACYGAHNGGDA
jgi:hypothetical protein